MKRLPTLATNPLRLPLEPPTHLDIDQHRGHGEHTVCHGEATALRFFFFLSQRTNDRPTEDVDRLSSVSRHLLSDDRAGRRGTDPRAS